jgi:hypothetical protein
MTPFKCPNGTVWISTGCFIITECTKYESMIDEANRCTFKPQPEGLWIGS